MIHIENENWDDVVAEVLWRIPKECREEMIERALIAIEKPKFTDRWRMNVGKDGKVTIFEKGKEYVY